MCRHTHPVSFMAYNRVRCAEIGAAYRHRDVGYPDQAPLRLAFRPAMRRDRDVPPHWWKTFYLHQALQDDADPHTLWTGNDRARGPYVPWPRMWLDSDAFLGPADARDLARSAPDASMWVSPDPPPWYNAPFCAGAFLVRGVRTTAPRRRAADADGRRLVAAWCDAFRARADRWQRTPDGGWRTDGVWVTLLFKNMRFGLEPPHGHTGKKRNQSPQKRTLVGAGDAYEQGAFINAGLLGDPAVRITASYVFNETVWQAPDAASVVVHLLGPHLSTFRGACFAPPRWSHHAAAAQKKNMYILRTRGGMVGFSPGTVPCTGAFGAVSASGHTHTFANRPRRPHRRVGRAGPAGGGRGGDRAAASVIRTVISVGRTPTADGWMMMSEIQRPPGV